MARALSDDEVKLVGKLVQSKAQWEIAERLGRSMKSAEGKVVQNEAQETKQTSSSGLVKG